MAENIKYYIYIDQKVQGPYELEEIEYMELSDGTQVCPEGTTNWTELGSILKKDVDLKTLLNNATEKSNKAPTKVGKYTIVKEIGRGGMGSVYLAMDDVLNRKVAVKELKVDEPRKKDKEGYEALKKRFQKEARVLAQLNNKNIVSIFDSIEDNDNQYMIMEFLDGKDLETLLKEKGVFSIEEAVSIVSDTCLALNYIHNKDIIHRDIKPSNIIIMNNGVVKLTDFGVTRDLNSATMTMSGSLVGTIAYASPEQDSRELDGRSDIFSLGIVLYELVTGVKPFTGDTLASVLLKIATKSPTSPTSINPKVHKMLEKIIFKAIEKSPNNRYTNAMDMYKDLQAYKIAIDKGDSRTLNCENEMKPSGFFASSAQTSARIDSIPPGKMKQQDVIANLSPTGKAKAEELLKSTMMSKPLPNLQQPEQKPLEQKQTQQQIIKPVIKTEQAQPPISKIAQTPVGMNIQQLKKPIDDLPDLQQILELNLDEPEVGEKPKTKEDVKQQKTKKNILKIKGKSHVESELQKEKMESIKQYVIPAVIFVFLLILFFIKQINFIDIMIVATIVGLAYYEYYTTTLSKFVSYSLMFITMFYAFLWLKTTIPPIENNEISPTIYYLLDFSLILISFIISFFVLRLLDYLSINKIKYLRPIGGLLKATAAILSIITIISFTDAMNFRYLSQELRYSKITNNVSKLLPSVRLGHKTSISLSKYGVKIKRK